MSPAASRQMPRMWSLSTKYAVVPLNDQLEKMVNESSILNKADSGGTPVKEDFTDISKPQTQPSPIKKPQNASCMPIFSSPSASIYGNSCIVPKDSIIIKEGELLKVGKKTQIMMSRYVILRDNALYIYRNKEQAIPSQIISLRGLYVN